MQLSTPTKPKSSAVAPPSSKRRASSMIRMDKQRKVRSSMKKGLQLMMAPITVLYQRPKQNERVKQESCMMPEIAESLVDQLSLLRIQSQHLITTAVQAKESLQKLKVLKEQYLNLKKLHSDESRRTNIIMMELQKSSVSFTHTTHTLIQNAQWDVFQALQSKKWIAKENVQRKKVQEVRDSKYQELLGTIERLTMGLGKAQIINQHTKGELDEANRIYEKVKDIKQTEQFQIHVLRLQLEMGVRIGFSAVIPPSDRSPLIASSLLMKRDIRRWEENRYRQLAFCEIKYFVVIQLYREWRKILNRLSYQYRGWSRLLGGPAREFETTQPEALLPFLPPKKEPGPSRKMKSLIIIGSKANPSQYQEIKLALQQELSQFNNGLIRVHSAVLKQIDPAVDELEIRYSFKDEEVLVKRFELHNLKEVTRQQVSKLIGARNEKCFLIRIEIIRINPIQDHLKYEELYDYLKRL